MVVVRVIAFLKDRCVNGDIGYHAAADECRANEP
jgi:hypothetical protein